MAKESDIEQRQRRLRALRAKREALSVGTGKGEAHSIQEKAQSPTEGRGSRAGGTSRVMLARLMLKTLQAGGQTGKLPGKGYTEQGVARFAALLRKRAEDQTLRGADMAKRLLQRVTQPSNDPQGMVAGINLAQLDQLVAFARKSMNDKSAGVNRADLPDEPAPQVGDLAEVRASVRQLAGRVADLAKQVQELAKAVPGAQPSIDPDAATGRPGGSVSKPSRQAVQAETERAHWVDDFVEDPATNQGR
jgi:hypothetical protein